MRLRPRQHTAVDASLAALEKHGNTLLVSPTGSGKCLGRGTPVLMFDGTVKAVEDVLPLDQLMGPDSLPRTVISATRGTGPLYRVTPTKGEPYVVNDAHILSLKMTPGGTKSNCSKSDTYKAGKVHNITVTDYLSRSKTFRHCAKGWRTGVEFNRPAQTFIIPPYILGAWLGDGHSRAPCVCTADIEIAAEWYAFGASVGLHTREEVQRDNASNNFFLTSGIKNGRNPVRTELKRLGVLENKHVPPAYLTASRAARLELLAGIIDTDGAATRGGFDVVFKSERLARDTTFLARSLGLAAYIKPVRKTCTNNGVTGDYWRISISGGCSIVPVRLTRKKAALRGQKKDPLLVGLRVEPIGEGEYFGFEITGDRLFMLGDFTVTHNTIMLSAVGGQRLAQAKKKKRPEQILILQHRDELTEQNRDKFLAVNPGTLVSTFNARNKSFGGKAVFAMVPTLMRESNLSTLPPFDTVIVDEAHHITADSYTRIIEKAREAYPDVAVFGVTATPNRGDGTGLRKLFSNVADQITIAELIASGHLVRPRTFVIDVGAQQALAGVRKLASDFDMQQVAAIMDRHVITDKVIEHWREKAGSRQTVVFCSNVAHAEHVTEFFQKAGVQAATVHGNLTPAERSSILSRYTRGDIQVVVNVAVLTEGWDHPPTSCVVLLRPSSYKSTMIQMIGRGLRTVNPEEWPGVVKTDCIVLDFGTSTLMHGSLEQDANLDGKFPGEVPTKQCEGCGAEIPLGCVECPLCGHIHERKNGEKADKTELSDFVLTEVDLLSRSNFKWVDIWGDERALMAAGFEAWSGIFWWVGVWHAIGGTQTEVKHLGVGDRIVALALGDDFLNQHETDSNAHKSKRWLREPATEKQLHTLGIKSMIAPISKYEAMCQISFRFNQHRIQQRVLNYSKQKEAA